MASPMGPVPKLGALLARATFEPDLVMTDGVASLVDSDGNVEGWMPYRKVFDVLWRGKRHVMMGAAQIDRFGNQNISCVGSHAQPKVQLLGARGAPGNTACHVTSYWVPKHSMRIFVPQVDFVCGIGTNNGAVEIRRVVSDLGVFDFGGPDGGMRIVSLHPGVTVDQVADATGFPVHVPETVSETRAPTDVEVAWIAANT
ncbi:MAG: CoA-transferase [Proteobacteria bacterium]|nr:CoA-transferase [Pseudomonadota bacterium]